MEAKNKKKIARTNNGKQQEVVGFSHRNKFRKSFYAITQSARNSNHVSFKLGPTTIF